jgi:hypothetical protein
MTDTATAGPLEPYLLDEERLCHLLTNRRVGIERGDEGAVRPSEGAGAYLGLTDRRLIVLVVDPVDRDTDFVTSHRYTNIVDVTVQRGNLIPCVEFETGYGRMYSFTARESDIETVGTFLSVSCAAQRGASTDRAELAEHCGALSNHLAAGEWAAFDSRVPAAMEAVETIRGGTASTPLAGGVERDLHCLVRDRYVLAGRETVASARHHLEAGELAPSYRRARTAYDHFETALERARREGVATETAIVGLTRADDIADTSLGRLFATGRHQFTRGVDGSSYEERIEGLEAAVDIYGTVASLVADDAAPEQARERAREEATNAIEALVDARLERARERHDAADWERAVGNETAARELAESALADLERTLELATAYPPGDADAIRDRQAELVAAFDPSEG